MRVKYASEEKGYSNIDYSQIVIQKIHFPSTPIPAFRVRSKSIFLWCQDCAGSCPVYCVRKAIQFLYFTNILNNIMYNRTIRRNGKGALVELLLLSQEYSAIYRRINKFRHYLHS